MRFLCGYGCVASSSRARYSSASALLWPHISMLGRRLLQTAGRSGHPKMRQRFSGVSWTQRTPAGLPLLMSGIGDEIDGAMQQAAQPGRHSIVQATLPEGWLNSSL